MSLRMLAPLVLALLLARASVAQTVETPAWAPTVGEEITWRVRVSNSVDFGGDVRTSRGSFVNQMKVVAREGDGYRIVWRVNAEPPADAAIGDFPVNDEYERTIAFWGLDSLTVVTDAAGAVLRVVDIDALRENFEKRVGSAMGDVLPRPGSILDNFEKQLEADPIPILYGLVPAMQLIALEQGASPDALSIGEQRESEDSLVLEGLKLPGKFYWQPVSRDAGARTLAIESLLLIDADLASYVFQSRINALIGELVGKQGLFLPNGQPLSNRATAERFRRVTISLVDGATVDAADVVMSRLGPLWTRSEVTITRE